MPPCCPALEQWDVFPLCFTWRPLTQPPCSCETSQDSLWPWAWDVVLRQHNQHSHCCRSRWPACLSLCLSAGPGLMAALSEVCPVPKGHTTGSVIYKM